MEEQGEERKENNAEKPKYNLAQYLGLIKTRKDLKSLREWFNLIQAQAKKDLSEADFHALVSQLRITQSQIITPDPNKQMEKATKIRDYMADASDLADFNRRFSEIAKDKTNLPSVYRTWLNNELEEIKKGRA